MLQAEIKKRRIKRMKKDTTNDMTVGSPVSLIIKIYDPNVPGKSFSAVL